VKCRRCEEPLGDWQEEGEFCPDCEDLRCPACGNISIHVGHRIYCIYGCYLRWYKHGALIPADTGAYGAIDRSKTAPTEETIAV
jgi:hypothetical protein